MTGSLSKEIIIQQLNQAITDFISFTKNINDELFYTQPGDKWSVAENVAHLIIATKSTITAYILPKFIVRWYAGKPNRPSRSYDELVAKYQLKLKNGGKAGGRFIPKQISNHQGKENLLQDFSTAMKKLVTAIQYKWNDNQLDQYIAPHPLLGKITLRELCYFTIYHTYHHLDIIKGRSLG